MKYLIVCLLNFLFISNIKAQSNSYKDSLLNSLEKNRYSLKDNYKLPFNNFNKLNQNNYQLNTPQLNTTPKTLDDCVILPKPSLVFVGNSNHANIYQSSPDKMYITKPDSTIQFGMPVAGISK